MAAPEDLYSKLRNALDSTLYKKRSRLRKIFDEDIIVFKNLTYETLMVARNDFIREHRASTVFDYKLNYSLKGCENKIIKLDKDGVYLTVTNLPELRYLDLPVYGINMNKHYKDVAQIPEIISEQSARDNVLIDLKNSYTYIQLETVFANLLSVYNGDVREILEEEYENNEIMLLLIWWDAKRFKKFLDFYMHRPRTPQAYLIFLTLVTVLERNSTDSELIAESFRKMCTYCRDRNFASFLPAKFLHFMLKHLKLSAKGPELFGQHQEWLSAENLVAKKFYRGDKSSLKLLLQYNCPTLFHPSYVDTFFPDGVLPSIDYWPRRSAGCTSASFNSLNYYVYITCLIIVLLSHTSDVNQENIEDCIRLLWASIPTPIIPIADVTGFLLTMRECFNWRETFTFVRFFPLEYDIPHQPRRLMHLSRYAFVQGCRDPEGISSLRLPQTLKAYLKFDA